MSRTYHNRPQILQNSPFFDFVSEAALKVDRASSYFCGCTSTVYSPYTPSRVTFSAIITELLLVEKEGGDSCADAGKEEKDELAIVNAANAPMAAF